MVSLLPVTKEYLSISGEKLIRSSKEKRSDITELARFVVRNEANPADVQRVYDLFYNRYKGRLFGSVRNFFYRLFNFGLQKELDSKVKSLRSSQFFEGVPPGSESARTRPKEVSDFLEKAPSPSSKQHVIHKKPADETEDFLKLPYEDQKRLKQEALTFLQNFAPHPVPNEFGLCSKELHTVLVLLDPSNAQEHFELCSLLHTMRPKIEVELKSHVQGSEIASNGELVLRAIDLLDVKSHEALALFLERGVGEKLKLMNWYAEGKDIAQLIELVPEFRRLDSHTQEAIRTFIQHVTLDTETRDRIVEAFEKGALEPLFTLVRSHPDFDELFPEITKEQAVLERVPHVTKKGEGVETWVEEFATWKISNEERIWLDREARDFVKHFRAHPNSAEFGRCFRAVYQQCQNIQYDDLNKLIELVPEFKHLREPATKEAIRTFLQHLPLDQETHDRIKRALQQGILEPIFSIMRARPDFVKLFPEIAAQGALFRGAVRATGGEEEWIEDFSKVAPAEKERMKESALIFLHNFVSHPMPDELGICFRALSTLLSLIDPKDKKEHFELCSLMHRLRPWISKASIAYEDSMKEKAIPVSLSQMGEPELSEETEKRLLSVTSSGQLLLRAIDLLEARTRILAKELSVDSSTTAFQPIVPSMEKSLFESDEKGYVSTAFFMSELGLPPAERPTFQFVKKEHTDRIFLQAQDPTDELARPVLLEVKERGLEPVDQRSITPILVAAYYLIHNASYEEAKKLMSFSVMAQFPLTELENQKKLFQLLEELLVHCSQDQGARELLLIVAATQLRAKSKDVTDFSPSMQQLLKTIAESHRNNDDFKQASDDVLKAFGAVSHPRASVPPAELKLHFKLAPPSSQVARGEVFDPEAIADPDKRKQFTDFVTPLPTASSPLLSAKEAMPQVQEQYHQIAQEAYTLATRQTKVEATVAPLHQRYSQLYVLLNDVTMGQSSTEVVDHFLAIGKEFRSAFQERQKALLLKLAILGKTDLTIEELLVLYGKNQLPIVCRPDQLESIRGSIQDYLASLQELQKYQRLEPDLLVFLKKPSHFEDDFNDTKKELLERVESTRAYDCMNPDLYQYQVFEVLADLLVSKSQFDALQNLKDPTKSIIIQKLMGGGKTFLMLPLLALLRADGDHLSISMVPKSLRPEVVKRLRTVLGRGYNRLVTDLHVEEGKKVPLQAWQEIEQKLTDARVQSGCLIVSPEDMYAIINTYTELLSELSDHPSEEIRAKLHCLDTICVVLKSKGVVIADEVDDTLKTSLEHVIAEGEAHQFDEVHAKLVSGLVLASPEIARRHKVRLDFDKHSPSGFISCTEKLFHERLKTDLVTLAIAELQKTQIMGVKEAENWKKRLENRKLENAVVTYLSRQKRVSGDEEVARSLVEIEKLPPELKNRLAILRHSLNEVFPKTFDREWNKAHGYLDEREDVVASPFGGAGVFTGTQFSNPIEQIACTIETLLRQGPPRAAIEKQYREQLVSLPSEERDEFINTRIREIQANPTEYLQGIVFPEIIEYDSHVAGNAHKLVDLFSSFSGMTGTFWNVPHMPGFDEFIPDMSTEVQSLERLQEKEKQGEIQVQVSETKSQDVLIDEQIVAKDSFMLIDCGGGLRKVQVGDFTKEMCSFAKTHILEKRPDLEAVFFYDKEGKILVLRRNQDVAISITAQDEQLPPNKRFTIYDQQHTFGADLLQDSRAVGALTIGKDTTLRDFLQGAWRARKIAKHQGLHILIDQDTAHAMRDCLGNDIDMSKFSTLIRFLIVNQVSKRVQESYGATQQRVQNVIESALRQAISSLLQEVPPKYEQVCTIFRDNEQFFIRKESGTAWEKYGTIPRYISSHDRVEQDSHKYLGDLKKLVRIPEVARALGVTNDEAITALIKSCYDETQLEQELPEHGIETVGRIYASQRRIEDQERFSVKKMGEDLEHLRERVRSFPSLIQPFTHELHMVEAQYKKLDKADQIARPTLSRRIRQLAENIDYFVEQQERATALLQHRVSAEASSCSGYQPYRESLQKLERVKETVLSLKKVALDSAEYKDAVDAFYREVRLVDEFQRDLLDEQAMEQQQRIELYNRASASALERCARELSGTVRDSLLYWQGELTRASSLLSDEKNSECVQRIVQAISTEQDVDLLKKMFQTLDRSEFEIIRAGCAVQLTFLEERRRAIQQGRDLAREFPDCQALMGYLARLESKECSSETYGLFSQELKQIYSFLRQLSWMKEQAGTCQIDSHFKGFERRFTEQFQELVKRATVSMKPEALENVSQLFRWYEEAVKESRYLLDVQRVATGLIEHPLFVGQKPPFGELKQLFEREDELRHSLLEASRKLNQDMSATLSGTDMDLVAKQLQEQRASFKEVVASLEQWRGVTTTEALEDDLFELQSIETELQEYSVRLKGTKRVEIDHLIRTLQKVSEIREEGEEITLDSYCESLKSVDFRKVQSCLQEARHTDRTIATQRATFTLRPVKEGHVQCAGLRTQYESDFPILTRANIEAQRPRLELARNEIQTLEGRLQIGSSLLQNQEEDLARVQEKLKTLPQFESLFREKLASLEQRRSRMKAMIETIGSSQDISICTNTLGDLQKEITLFGVDISSLLNEVEKGRLLQGVLEGARAHPASINLSEYSKACQYVQDLFHDDEQKAILGELVEAVRVQALRNVHLDVEKIVQGLVQSEGGRRYEEFRESLYETFGKQVSYFAELVAISGISEAEQAGYIDRFQKEGFDDLLRGELGVVRAATSIVERELKSATSEEMEASLACVKLQVRMFEQVQAEGGVESLPSEEITSAVQTLQALEQAIETRMASTMQPSKALAIAEKVNEACKVLLWNGALIGAGYGLMAALPAAAGWLGGSSVSLLGLGRIPLVGGALSNVATRVATEGVKRAVTPLVQWGVRRFLISRGVSGLVQHVVNPMFASASSHLPERFQFLGTAGALGTSILAQSLAGRTIGLGTAGGQMSFAQQYLTSVTAAALQKGLEAAPLTLLRSSSGMVRNIGVLGTQGVAFAAGLGLGFLPSNAAQAASSTFMTAAYQNAVSLASRPVIDAATNHLPGRARKAAHLVLEEGVALAADLGQAKVFAVAKLAAEDLVGGVGRVVTEVGGLATTVLQNLRDQSSSNLLIETGASVTTSASSSTLTGFQEKSLPGAADTAEMGPHSVAELAASLGRTPVVNVASALSASVSTSSAAEGTLADLQERSLPGASSVSETGPSSVAELADLQNLTQGQTIAAKTEQQQQQQQQQPKVDKAQERDRFWEDFGSYLTHPREWFR